MLVAIVGPSGTGKDTLMNAARTALAGDPRFVFVRRAITRPMDAGGEDHEPCTPDIFALRGASGEFALEWHVHGLSYGIPAVELAPVGAGAITIVNLSRTVISQAEHLFPRLAVIEIFTPAAILAERLAARGRESRDEIATRLAREAPLSVTRAELHRIFNDRDLASVIAEFIGLLEGFAD